MGPVPPRGTNTGSENVGYGNGAIRYITNSSQTTAHIQAPKNHYPAYQELLYNQIPQPGNQGYHHQVHPNTMHPP